MEQKRIKPLMSTQHNPQHESNNPLTAKNIKRAENSWGEASLPSSTVIAGACYAATLQVQH